jgi:hypothetical protein
MTMWTNAKILGADRKRGEHGQFKRGDKQFVMSRTELVDFAPCPAKWLASEHSQETSDAMDFGSLLDCLSTTPEKLWDKFAIQPATYPAEGKKGEPPTDKKWNNNATFCKEWIAKAESEGKTVISQKMFDEAQLAFNSLKANEAIASLINDSARQVLIVADWKDEATGLTVPFAALLDLVPPSDHPTWGKCLADIKTARNGNPASWARVCDDSGYDVQAAIYFDIYKAARPNEDRTDFVHIVQENTFPFHVVSPPPAFSSEFLDWGRLKYKNALRKYCQCLATGIWPSYEQVGIPFGNTQLIEPSDLWNYKKGVGFAEFKMPQDKPPTTESYDVQP